MITLELTQRHRIRQNALAEATARRVERAWVDIVDPANIDSTRRGFVNTALGEVLAGHVEGERLAAQYLADYRESVGVTGPVTSPGADIADMVTDLDLYGPVQMKLAVKGGASQADAFKAAGKSVGAVSRTLVLNGGRNLIIASADADPRSKRWRRVTDGDPCAFCALLASRGPVYTSDASASFEVHKKGCGCTVELCYYSRDEWEPTDKEQAWVDAYNRAAEVAKRVDGVKAAPKPGKGRDTVLRRMRRMNPELFHDGVYSK